MMLQYLWLEPGQEPEARESVMGYDALVAAVGYPLEVIHLDGGPTMYVCEEGKAKGWPVNEAATKLAAPVLRNGDRVVGSALVLGPLSGGNDTSLSNEALAELLESLR